MALCYVHDQVDKSDLVLQEQIADTIMIFLPGIIGGLQEIIMEGEIQNHKVTMVRYSCIHLVIIFTFWKIQVT